MMELLDLPNEVIGKIMEAVVDVGLDHAMLTRFVCKTFDTEILRAINSTRALDSEGADNQGAGKRYCGERLLCGYLLARTLSDHHRKHFSSQIIGETVDYIFKDQPYEKALRFEYLSSLCDAVVRAYNSQAHSYHEGPSNLFYEFLNPSPQPMDVKYPKSGLSVLRKRVGSLTERALAASALLNIKSLFEQLIRDKVGRADTCFGDPLSLAAERGAHSMTAAVLEAEKNKPAAWIEAIESAAKGGQQSLLQRLLDPDYNLGILDRSQIEQAYPSWVRAASTSGHFDMVQYLLGRATREGFYDGKAPRHRVPWRIRRSPWKIDMLSASGYLQAVVVWAAALNGHEDIVRQAFTNGTHPNTPRDPHFGKVFRLIDAAAKGGHEDIVRLVLAELATAYEKCPMTDSAKRGCSHALIRAIKGGWLTNARTILASGAAEIDPEPDRDRAHPLATAINRNQTDMVRFLLRNGADISGQRKVVQEALSFAEAHGYTSIVCAMAEYGIKVVTATEIDDGQCIHRRTPLCSRCHLSLAEHTLL